MNSEKMKQFAIELYKINAIKFGEYKTKIGIMTPVYCDLRVIVSYPKLLQTLSDLLIEHLENISQYNIVCGVPYTALPIATVFSIKTGVPMVMRRKETKDYGTKKLIEGVFKEGDNCLIIEDVVTSGSSILETVKDLQHLNIKCTDAIVLLNREQGGEAILKNNGIKMHSLLSLTELITYLKEADCIDELIVEKVKNYLKNNQVSIEKVEPINRLKMSFLSRSKLAKNPIASKLLEIMAKKETTLCVAADLTDSCSLLNLAEQVGPHICALKLHIDIIEDFHPNLIKPLQDIAKQHNFLLFEDRKFADIGKTVQLQLTKGIHKISSWANLITAHSLFGSEGLTAIKTCSGNIGVFLLAQASSAGCLIDDNYTKATIKLAGENADLIAGIVAQSPLALDQPGFIQLTPGVQLEVKSDNLGQQYNSPNVVVLERGADVAVVGRGITQANEPVETAKLYKELLWKAYLKRIESQL